MNKVIYSDGRFEIVERQGAYSIRDNGRVVDAVEFDRTEFGWHRVAYPRARNRIEHIRRYG